MEVIDNKLVKSRLQSKNFLGSGCFGKVYKNSENECLKVCGREYFKDCFVDVYNIIKNNKLECFYELISLLYSNYNDAILKRNAIGYKYQYIEKEDIDILTMPTEYTLDNLNSLYNSISILSKNNIRCIDLQEGNVIINNDSITVIDTDLYSIYNKEKSMMVPKWNTYDLESLFQSLYTSAMDKYHNGKYPKEVKRLLYSLFMMYDYGGIYGVYQKLKNYKYPIDYVKKLKVLCKK